MAPTATAPSTLQRKVAQHESAFAADTAPALDVTASSDQAGGGLASLVSGPLLTAKYSTSDVDAIAAEECRFAQLCHDGTRLTRKNLLGKALRCVTLPIKQLYVPPMTRSLPTNHLMLTFRTFNRDYEQPNANADNLAQDLRDTLMPARGKAHRAKSAFLRFKMALLQTPILGLPGIVNFIDVRTQWFDGAVLGAIADGIKQVVIIAAGYDTRAYRLAAPGVRFYEIDLPHASQKKQELVRKHMPADKFSWPEFVGADLSQVSLMQALSGTSWDPAKRSLFIIEGLTYYLSPDAFKQQLTAISETAVVGSRLFMDTMRLDYLSAETCSPGLETMMLAVWNKGEPFRSGVTTDPDGLKVLLKKFGFRLYEQLDEKDISARFHPHVKTNWWRAAPHVTPCFNYCAAEKVYAPMQRVDTLETQAGKQQAQQQQGSQLRRRQ